MKKRYIFLIVTVLCYGLYKLAYPTYSWNQKLTVAITTPNGDKTGSAVVSAKVVFSPQIIEHVGGVNIEWRGEATVVDLGQGRHVFALIGHPVYLALESFEHLIIPSKNIPKTSGLYRPQTSLYPMFKNIRDIVPVKSKNHHPTLVTFRDITDPASVELLTPNDLVSAFGKGYALKEMTLEITDENVTTGTIKKLLGTWLGEYYNKRLDGLRFQSIKSQNQFANSLSSGVFDTEKNQ